MVNRSSTTGCQLGTGTARTLVILREASNLAPPWRRRGEEGFAKMRDAHNSNLPTTERSGGTQALQAAHVARECSRAADCLLYVALCLALITLQ